MDIKGLNITGWKAVKYRRTNQKLVQAQPSIDAGGGDASRDLWKMLNSVEKTSCFSCESSKTKVHSVLSRSRLRMWFGRHDSRTDSRQGKMMSDELKSDQTLLWTVNCGGSAFCFWQNESSCDIFSDKPPCSSFEALLSRSITQKLHAVWVLKVSGFFQWASFAQEEPASKVCWCLLTCIVCFSALPLIELGILMNFAYMIPTVSGHADCKFRTQC